MWKMQCRPKEKSEHDYLFENGDGVLVGHAADVFDDALFVALVAVDVEDFLGKDVVGALAVHVVVGIFYQPVHKGLAELGGISQHLLHPAVLCVVLQLHQGAVDCSQDVLSIVCKLQQPPVKGTKELYS